MRPFLLTAVLIAAAPAQAAAAPQDLLLTAHGAEGDQLGWSVAAVGDIDRDGAPDWAVGAPQGFSANPGATGYVRILSGRDGSAILTLSGGRPGEDFGYAVAGAGDVNRDGLGDIAVGSRFASGNGENSGAVTVFSGMDGRVLSRVPGPAPMADFGAAVAGVGDVDGDDVPDLLVGAPSDDSAGRDAGSIFVHSGRDGRLLHRFGGEAIQHRYGAAVSALGDVDGDRRMDFLVGAPQAGDGGEGRVYTLSGRTGQVLHVVSGAQQGDGFGSSLSQVGDVNGDGIQDWMAGAPSVAEPGSAQVHSGRDGALLFRFTGDWAGGRFGAAVAGVGDVDHDGHADVAVGAPRDGGGGIDAGLVRVYSGRNGAVLGSYYGLPGEQFGAALAGYRAFLGAGGFLAGSPGAASQGRAAGLLRVYRGPQKMPAARGVGDYAVSEVVSDSTGPVESIAYDDELYEDGGSGGAYSLGIGYGGGSTSFYFSYGSPAYYGGPYFYYWYPYWWYWDCWSYWYRPSWYYRPYYGWGFWSWGYCWPHGYYGHGYCGHHHHYDHHHDHGGHHGGGGNNGGGGGNPPPPQGPTRAAPSPVGSGTLAGGPGGGNGGPGGHDWVKPSGATVSPGNTSGGLVQTGAGASGKGSGAGNGSGTGKGGGGPKPGAIVNPSQSPKRLPPTTTRKRVDQGRLAPTVVSTTSKRRTMPPAWSTPNTRAISPSGFDLGGQSTLSVRPNGSGTRGSTARPTRSTPQPGSGSRIGSTPRSGGSSSVRPSTSRGNSRSSAVPSGPRTPTRSSARPSTSRSSSRPSARPSSSRGSSRSSARSSSRGSSRGSASRGSSRGGGSRGRGRG